MLFWPARFLRADGMKIIARKCVCEGGGRVDTFFFVFFFLFWVDLRKGLLSWRDNGMCVAGFLKVGTIVRLSLNRGVIRN